MRNTFRRLILPACVALFFPVAPLPAQDAFPKSPCDIHGICSFKKAVTHYGTSYVTLVDDTGHIFIVAYVDPGVLFKRQDGTKVKSKPGSPEEQCLLALLKRSYAAAFPTPLPKEPFEDAAGKKKYGAQYTIQRLIGIFQRRCVTMDEENLRDH